ncbi:hypothetical protein [Jiangella asiatica]|uniref:Uncharacterized protein n=1 Tax=Jiangella asiatica TaxID=2530372 RepID=A0A4R5D488_9ACTN|nr:hypothetical protein [Jiangella asiatica]TDE08209.1 hypothetical protein E1269_18030 [Jiangella asiatica]
MNGDPVLFGLLPHDTTTRAYAFRCPVCDKVRSTAPDQLCRYCARVVKPTRRRTTKGRGSR